MRGRRARQANGALLIESVADPAGSSQNGAVMKLPAGSTQPVILAAKQNPAVTLALDGDWVFYAGDFSLFKVPKSGGPAVQLEGGGSVGTLATDASYVYLANGIHRTVLRRAK